ncbi:hypothetical protein GCM10022415_31900 [Knoellia locipacati]|uniref:ABC transporter ATP-binding protein n=1 Tax=Knoellia locipacati TaxID=882824 RepID=A0A512T3L2_9MICO|nr:ABC transporter ATP-binding protein [Knoellia locipacati]GEQ14806.1 hypothetical protein KLO01_28530 [Knoellia locipacati]
MKRHKGEDRQSAYLSVLSQAVGSHRRLVVALAVSSFAGALLEASFLVLITATALALVNGSGTIGPFLGETITTGAALGIGAVALALRLALNFASLSAGTRLTAEITQTERRRLSHAYLGSSWAVQQAEPSGRLQELLTSFVVKVSWAITTLANAVTALLSLLAFLSAGFIVDAASTLAVLAALTVVGAVLVPIRRRVRRRAAASAVANLEFATKVSELGSLGIEMQAFGVQQRFADEMDRLTVEAAVKQRRVDFLTATMAPAYLAIAYSAILGGVAVLAFTGYKDLAVIGGVMLLMLRSLSYGQQLTAALGSLAAAVPFLEAVSETVAKYTEAKASGGSRHPGSMTPLTATGVDFRYPNDRVALSDITFRIESREAIGIIGPSGAGKSTLAQLLLGLREPTSGTLCVDGVDMREVDRSWWSSRVGFVPQDANLFTGTVAENIRFFREGIDDDALRSAARRANILADVEALPHGFDTHLGERGGQLSGGQRQRLSIARALAADPELLVLDEPTSALDGASEALIRRTLSELRQGMTVVIIAHRMSTLDICDRIMVIEDGRMTRMDSPATLRESSDFYRQSLAHAGIL